MRIAAICLFMMASQVVLGLTFQQTQMLYERKVGELAEKEQNLINELKAGYTVQLKNLMESHAKAGNLDGALAVKGELNRVASDEDLGAEDFDPLKAPRLKSLRNKFDDGRESMQRRMQAERTEAQKKYRQLLEKEVQQLTRQGKLVEAVEVRDELIRLEKLVEPKEKEVGADDLKKYLGGKIYRLTRQGGASTKLHFKIDGTSFTEDAPDKPLTWSAEGRRVVFSSKGSRPEVIIEFTDDGRKFSGTVLANGSKRKGILDE